MKQEFSSISVNATRLNNMTVNLECELFDWKGTSVSYIAAQAPDYNQSFSGSALPFPDSIVAFDNTTNRGTFSPTSSKFTIKLKFPNSYYSHLGTRLIPPYVRITVRKGKYVFSEVVELGEIAPFRLLTYPSNPIPRAGPYFYKDNAPKKARSQETILRQSAYRLNTPKNFWGNAIPHP